MQDLAEDYQRALADISSLRAIYDAEIESLQEEVSQCKAAKEEELWWAVGVRGIGDLNCKVLLGQVDFMLPWVSINSILFQLYWIQSLVFHSILP